MRNGDTDATVSGAFTTMVAGVSPAGGPSGLAVTGFDSSIVFNRVSNQVEVAAVAMVALITY
jgi:hypothetical protein